MLLLFHYPYMLSHYPYMLFHYPYMLFHYPYMLFHYPYMLFHYPYMLHFYSSIMCLHKELSNPCVYQWLLLGNQFNWGKPERAPHYDFTHVCV